MRSLRFSTAILSIVLLALLFVSGALLLLAYEGSQTALDEEVKLTYDQDHKVVSRMVKEYLTGVAGVAEEIAKRNDIRASAAANDFMTIDMILGNSIRGPAGERIHAIVVDVNDLQPVVVNGVSMYSMDLALNTFTNDTTPMRAWDNIMISTDEGDFHLLRYKTPIISQSLGEVMGALYAYILVNDNYWLLSEIQEITGAGSLSFFSGMDNVGSLEASMIHPNELLVATPNSPIVPLSDGTAHFHSLTIGREPFRLYLHKPGNSSLRLTRAYNENLLIGTVTVILISLIVMALIRSLTQRSLGRLLKYAEKVPYQVIPTPYKNGLFDEFNKVGTEIEEMVRDIRAQENQLDAIFHNAPSLMFIKSADLKYIMVNPKAPEHYQCREVDILGSNDFDLLPQKQAEILREADLRVVSQHRPAQCEYSIDQNGTTRHYLCTKFPLLRDSGEVYAIGGITTDITDKVNAEAEAQISNKVFEAAAEAILIMNDKGKVLTNSAFTRITGYSSQRARRFALSLLAEHPEIEIALDKHGRWKGESTQRRANGEQLPVWASISVVEEITSGKIYVAVFSDISDLKEAEQKLEKLAHYDNLTGLPNRTLFYDRFESALQLSERLGSKTALLFIDLDRFKPINDNYGHHVGDKMLIEAAGRIRQHIRPSDTVSRLGGDEFTVILSDLSSSDVAQDIARRIQSELKKVYVCEGKELFSSASIGIALYPDDGRNTQVLLKHADTAMYHIKERGRNDIMFFDKALNAQAEARIQLEENLRMAINTQSLFLVYQPRFDIAGQRVLSAEALIRWHHPIRGMIPPSEFIVLAEECGLIVELGRMVLRRACQAAKDWNQILERPVPVSVNLSARQLHSEELVSDIEAALKSADLAPELLELEITETMVIEDLNTVIETLQSIRALGVKMSVDDFGTGYSSLIYLKRLPVSTVKIDRSFIDDVPGSEDGESLVKAIISMSHTLNLRVVAEGVEEQSQLAFLRQHQCDEIQGFLLAKPDHPSKIHALLSHELNGSHSATIP